MVVIFLGVSTTMSGPITNLREYNNLLKELFGMQKHYSVSQHREADSYFLLPSAVSSLNKIISKVEDEGKKVGVVIASACGHDCTTEQVCTKLFKPFFTKFVIGRTPSIDKSFDPELKRRLSEGKPSFKELSNKLYGLKLSNHIEQIQYWIKEHGIQNYVVLRLIDKFSEATKAFGDRFIDTTSLLNDDHCQAALKVLLSKRTYESNPKFRGWTPESLVSKIVEADYFNDEFAFFIYKEMMNKEHGASKAFIVTFCKLYIASILKNKSTDVRDLMHSEKLFASWVADQLGKAYESGIEIETSLKKALDCKKMAGKLGHATALNDLGIIYIQGNTVEQNTEKALTYFKNASEHGCALAHANLGLIYLTGNGGVEKDPEKAHSYYRLAVENKETGAYFNYGLMLFRGIGISQDKEQGLMYIQKASEHGIEEAIEFLKY